MSHASSLTVSHAASHAKSLAKSLAKSNRSPRLLDALEQRRLLSASSLTKRGVLYVECPDDQANVVSVFFDEAGALGVAVNGETALFDYAKVKRLVVLGGAMDDAIEVSEQFTRRHDLRGEEGNDNIITGAGRVRVDASDGDDVVTLRSTECKSRVDAGSGNDVVSGTNCADLLIGGTGNDTMYGGDGDDRIFAGSGNDSVEAGAGNDRVLGGKGNDVLLGEDGNDVIFGERGDDLLDGGEGDDRLHGVAGVDTLLGRAGNDTLHGGGDGLDSLDGGDGENVVRGREHKKLTQMVKDESKCLAE